MYLLYWYKKVKILTCSESLGMCRGGCEERAICTVAHAELTNSDL
jgi:hypothetical protein